MRRWPCVWHGAPVFAAASRGQVGRFDNPVPSSHATKDYFHHGDDDIQVSEGVRLDAATLGGHILEKGVGKNHRCFVCQRRHSQYLRDHPGIHPNSNPFKRSKTSFRCTVCKVYLCAQEERQCWWIWHQTQVNPKGTSPLSWMQDVSNAGRLQCRRTSKLSVSGKANLHHWAWKHWRMCHLTRHCHHACQAGNQSSVSYTVHQVYRYKQHAHFFTKRLKDCAQASTGVKVSPLTCLCLHGLGRGRREKAQYIVKYVHRTWLVYLW